jgi:hypothetical protein
MSFRLLTLLHALLACFILIFSFVIGTGSKTIEAEELSACALADTPASKGASNSWRQNVIVRVNVNSSQFSLAEYTNGIKPVFDNYNSAASVTQNASGVRFCLTYSTNPVALINPNTSGARNAVGVANGLEVEKNTFGGTAAAGATTDADSIGYRDSAVIRLNSLITDTTAMKQILAHEVGHTFALEHCGGVNGDCATTASVMKRSACLQNEPINQCLNRDQARRTSPSECDNQKIKEISSYNAASVNQPSCPTPTPTPTPTPYPTPHFPNGCADPYENFSQGSCPYGFSSDETGYYCCENPPTRCENWLEESGCPPDIGYWQEGYPYCECLYSPIVLDIDGNGFRLTDAANGIPFDINGDGTAEQLAWTAAGSDEAWLVLDRNGNGVIDNGKELFGSVTEQSPHPAGEPYQGFSALAEFDKPANGGNSDGKISVADVIYDNLRLWRDGNHDGFSDAGELKTLSELGVAEIELAFKESKRTDEFGNLFRFRSKVKNTDGQQSGRWAWDVFLTRQSQTASTGNILTGEQLASDLSVFGGRKSRCRRV